MTLGLWIFASVVLILMVYHAKFRKVMFWIAGLSAVGVGLFFLALYLYNAYEERVQKAQAEAAQKAWKASVAACETRFAANGWNGTQGCLLNPDKPAPPIASYLPVGKWIDVNGDLMDIPGGFETKTIDGKTQLVRIPTSTPTAPKPKSFAVSAPKGWADVVSYSAEIRKRCYFNAAGSMTVFQACGWSSDDSVATVRKGDRVQVLSAIIRSADGSDIVNVKFQQWVGWILASELDLSTH